MKDIHDILAPTHIYDEDIWFNKYYQMGNRITFLEKLTEQGFKVKLALLNFVNDSTHIKTSKEHWEDHYKNVFDKMLGKEYTPKNVILVNFEVKNSSIKK